MSIHQKVEAKKSGKADKAANLHRRSLVVGCGVKLLRSLSPMDASVGFCCARTASILTFHLI
jgi:hypothetical protein